MVLKLRRAARAFSGQVHNVTDADLFYEEKNLLKHESVDWTSYRSRFALTCADEIDLHFGERDPHTPYENVMAEIRDLVKERLKQAQKNNRPYLMFVHGKSTSRRGKTTARSQVRKFMRSKEATPLIRRKCCIQHDTVFLAKIREEPLIEGC